MPRFIKDEFDAFLECGILAHGFLRLRCGECGHDKLLAFSCKRRDSAPLAAPGACRRPLRTWSTTSSRTCRCGNGCCRCRSRCACCWPRSRNCPRRCCRWCSAWSRDICCGRRGSRLTKVTAAPSR
ncbi:transposase zinc-binding domain-containing protein [Ottowia sp.]|uniref:transposase zinc-binding domain-containing protein n=1 Tax=Ottowia sp. TaxID=1898956 RepID=UPI0025DC1EFE|nr:transposase zinc-binding domain-containing protein [Ottowia sp.]